MILQKMCIRDRGKIAKILIQILRGFGINVLAYDLYPNYNLAREHQVVYCTLDEL